MTKMILNLLRALQIEVRFEHRKKICRARGLRWHLILFILFVPFMGYGAEIFEFCRLGEIEIVNDLLESDPDRVQSRDPEGNTLLHIAVRYDHKELVRLLMDFGASVNERNNKNRTPLHSSKCVYTANLLIDCGADIDAVDEDGNTPLHDACRSDDKGVVECLVENGADINASNKKNFTPLDYAIQGCRPGFSHFLIEYGAEVSSGRHKETDGVVPIIDRKKAPRLIKKVKPVLPSVCLRARICGVVILCVVLDEDGKVERATIISGHPLLRHSVLCAVKQYVYSPALINGRVRRVQFLISVAIDI